MIIIDMMKLIQCRADFILIGKHLATLANDFYNSLFQTYMFLMHFRFFFQDLYCVRSDLGNLLKALARLDEAKVSESRSCLANFDDSHMIHSMHSYL